MELDSFQLTSKDKFGPMSILKNIAVFAPASLFRVLAFSITIVFFKSWAWPIIFGYIAVLAIFLFITIRCCIGSWPLKASQEMLEACLMSLLTITNLGRGKTAALCRLVSTLHWTIGHTITFTVILAICNNDPGIIIVDWSRFPLVQNLTTLNILLGSSLCLGWLSLVLDVITAAVKNHYKDKNSDTEDQEEASFWDGAILLEGLKYQKCCS